MKFRLKFRILNKGIAMFNPQIIVLDFGSQYTQLIARRLREIGVYTEIMPYFESAESICAKRAHGIILSGGPASVYEKDAYKPNSRIFELGIPMECSISRIFLAEKWQSQVHRNLAKQN